MSQETSPTGASGRALATFILGLLSALCFGLITGIPAIIFGLLELKSIEKGQAPMQGKSLTKAGLIMGIIGTLFSVAVVLIIFLLLFLGMQSLLTIDIFKQFTSPTII